MATAGRTALCTVATGPFLDLLAIGRPSLVSFAERHGYELVEHHVSLAPDRPTSWSKVVALHQLAGEFDRVIWIDADAVVVDGSSDLAALLQPGRLLATAFHRYRGSVLPNLGVAVLRGGRASRALLEQMWACNDLIHHPWWENAALLRIIGYRTFEPVGPQRPTLARLRLQELDPAWNSIPDDPAPHPRIVHFAGRPHEVRLAEMVRLTSEAATPLPR